MLETGEFVRIRNGDEDRNRKPIGIYWLQIPGVALAHALGLARDNPVWPYRLPSLAGGMLLVLATHRLGRDLAGPRPAMLAALLLAGSVLLMAEVHLAKTDAMLAGLTALAMTVLAAARQRPIPAPAAATFWLALGLAILVKGPITPLILATTVATLGVTERRLAWLARLRPAWGLPLLLAVILPWFVAIGLATDGKFFADALGADLGRKVTGGDDAHGAPPGYHLLLAGLTLAGTSPWLLRALPGAWRDRRDPAIRLLLAWAGPAWVLFELAPTKLPHYPLPLFPPLCLLAARWLLAPTPVHRWLARIADVQSGVTLTGLGVAAAAIPVLIGGDVPALSGLPALLAAALAVSALLRPGRPPLARAARLLAGVALLGWTVLGLVLPSLHALWLAPRIVALFPAAPAPAPAPAVGAVGFTEPSLRFLAGTATRMLPDAAAAADFLAHAPRGALLTVDRRALPGVLERLPAALTTTIGSVDGLNYSNGRRTTVTVLERR